MIVTRIINLENQGQLPKEGSIGDVQIEEVNIEREIPEPLSVALPTIVVGLPEEKDEPLIIREVEFDESKIIRI